MLTVLEHLIPPSHSKKHSTLIELIFSFVSSPSVEESVASVVPPKIYQPLNDIPNNEVQTTCVGTFGVCCVRRIGYLGQLDLEDSAAINRRELVCSTLYLPCS